MPESVWDTACDLARRVDAHVVFDVGANRGTISRLFLDALPAARVFAFEPQHDLLVRLQEKFAGEPRLRAIGTALGERVGAVAFHRGANDATSSRYPRNVSGRRYYRSDFVMVGASEVPIDTMDAFCAKESIERVHLLKMDTQGGEHAILLGARELLEAGRVDIIVTEFFAVPHYEGAPLLDEIWSLLRRFGYGLYDLFCGPHGVNGQLRYGDAIFVSADFRARHLDQAQAEP